MNKIVDINALRRGIAVLSLSLILSINACSTVSNLQPDFLKGNNEKKIDESEQNSRISVLEFANELKADPELADLSPSVTTDVFSTSWNQPGGNSHNAPQYVDADAPFDIAWKRNTGKGSYETGRISASPILNAGIVYTMDAQHTVNALSIENGNKVWSTALAPEKRRHRGAVGGGLTLHQGQLFVATGYREVLALNAQSGEILWRKTFEAPFSTAPTARASRLFVNSNDNELFALDIATGEVLWTLQSIAEPARILSSTSPAVTDQVVIAPFASGELAAIFVENGQRAWTENLARMSRITSLATISDIPGRPVVANGLVYAASHAGDIAAIELRSGRVVWRREFGSVNTPWLSGDTLFAINTRAELAAINAVDGKVFWVTKLPLYKNKKKEKNRIAWFGPILAGEHLVLTSSHGHVVEVSPVSGDIIQERKIGSGFFMPPIAGESTVFLLDDKANLIALR